jgi:hypothetical protein
MHRLALKRGFVPINDLAPISSSWRDPEFFDEHADNCREGDGAGGDVPIVEVDLFCGHRVNPGV